MDVVSSEMLMLFQGRLLSSCNYCKKIFTPSLSSLSQHQTQQKVNNRCYSPFRTLCHWTIFDWLQTVESQSCAVGGGFLFFPEIGEAVETRKYRRTKTYNLSHFTKYKDIKKEIKIEMSTPQFWISSYSRSSSALQKSKHQIIGRGTIFIISPLLSTVPFSLILRLLAKEENSEFVILFPKPVKSSFMLSSLTKPAPDLSIVLQCDSK